MRKSLFPITAFSDHKQSLTLKIVSGYLFKHRSVSNLSFSSISIHQVINSKYPYYSFLCGYWVARVKVLILSGVCRFSIHYDCLYKKYKYSSSEFLSHLLWWRLQIHSSWNVVMIDNIQNDRTKILHCQFFSILHQLLLMFELNKCVNSIFSSEQPTEWLYLLFGIYLVCKLFKMSF